MSFFEIPSFFSRPLSDEKSVYKKLADMIKILKDAADTDIVGRKGE